LIYTTTLSDGKLSAENGYIRRQFKRSFYQDLSHLYSNNEEDRDDEPTQQQLINPQRRLRVDLSGDEDEQEGEDIDLPPAQRVSGRARKVSKRLEGYIT
jgi:AraC-like DNA-binding protein